MVVLYFSIRANEEKKITGREFVDYLKKTILGNDQKKVNNIELASHKELILNSLDSLLKTNDDLQKVDLEFESYLKHLEKKIFDLQPKAELKVALNQNPVKVDEAIYNFQWEDSKYPKSQKTIEQVMDKLSDKLLTTKNTIKKISDNYSAKQDLYKNLVKADNEALAYMKTDYRQILKKCRIGIPGAVSHEDDIVKTNYLTTMLCFVPITQIESFENNYMSILPDWTLPKSAKRLDKNEDEKMSMWRVVIMEHKKDEFIMKARSDFRIMVKEYDHAEIANMPSLDTEKTRVKDEMESIANDLFRSCSAGFSEVYFALLHLKYLRLYTESTLKFGSSEYHACVVFIPQGKEAQVVSKMIKTFSDTTEEGWYGTKDELKDTEDFFPFIMLKLGVPTSI